jgi:hypothetical protein
MSHVSESGVTSSKTIGDDLRSALVTGSTIQQAHKLWAVSGNSKIPRLLQTFGRELRRGHVAGLQIANRLRATAVAVPPSHDYGAAGPGRASEAAIPTAGGYQ